MRSAFGRVAGPVALAVALVVPLAGAGTASARPDSSRRLTVMTQNLYLGSSLAPAIGATTPTGFVLGVAQIYGTVQFTSFPARAEAIASEVATEHPDLIGLQEASTWTVTTYAANGASSVSTLDYLSVLKDRLAAHGLHYAVAAVSHNADIGNPAVAQVPLVAPCAGVACTLRFQDSDVILVDTDTAGLTVGNPRTGHYATQEILTTPVGSLSFDRGWATVDAALDRVPFRFAVTHLETEDFPAVQQAQGQEFLAAVKTPGAVLAVGDFNSAADGSTTTTYAGLTADYFKDAWAVNAGDPGLSCCRDGFLADPTAQLTSRIDLVLTHAVHALSAHLVGTAPFEATPPLWPSDHAGLVATVRVH
ncbi:MAG: endonuclease/exonuclease/phosphatase family protein [Mycobacteriales bacterium]